MKNYKYWENCIALLEKGQIQDAINYALDIAVKLKVPKEIIDKIMTVNLKGYENKIEHKMKECIGLANIENAEALCLYYSLDDGWQSTMYICKDYTKENNDWIFKSKNWVEIGKARGFSGIYKNNAESAFFADEMSSGICTLLMLRTTIAFYTIAEKFSDCGLKLCITATESDFVRVV
ncbi:hypothetical protein [Chryseobacterium polytrichastri]|uniref:Uncharacterized protein n=1 Tax=Chryseobacterium polytrichastri TaxID=1302687 RepID=A0A1M7HJT0_9FLAO|nr:hypothetical protein [Chryseobacterium polytrichastri]SHM28745.1 hypothetical protein SAMN05444267_10415 [Chryseobacterium polytrichastri]